MEDPMTDRDAKIAALRTAISHLSKQRLKATAGLGCERHMLGLQMAAQEMGLNEPRIFSDKVGFFGSCISAFHLLYGRGRAQLISGEKVPCLTADGSTEDGYRVMLFGDIK